MALNFVSNQTLVLAFVTIAALTFLAQKVSFSLLCRMQQRVIKEDVQRFRGLPMLGCSDFFSRRNDFIHDCLNYIDGNVCKFDLPNVSRIHILRPSVN